jgi:hypothetical protein
MADLSNKTKTDLPRIKEAVEAWYSYFKNNFDMFNRVRSFVFRSTLTADDLSVLANLKKPQLEFNILESYVSRLRGEFSKQEPSLVMSGASGERVDPQLLSTIEGHVRNIMFDANTNSAEYNIYTDLLSGGFSAIQYWTEYEHEDSFDQKICWDRVYDPCLTIFDPLARQSHKGDGAYCGQLFPQRKSDFERQNPNIDLRDLHFTRYNEQFNWSYRNQREDILLICDFYEKRKKKVKIVKLANGKVIDKKAYDIELQKWKNEGRLEQPAMVVSERWTERTIICRYRFIENQILEYEETDFTVLPIIFVDGNSLLLQDDTGTAVTQMARPYVYNAIGAQKLKNFAGQTLANELENMVQHKWIVAKEAIPADYLEAYKKPQLPSVIVHNAYNNNNPDQPLPAPREVQRIPIPQEVTATFGMTDSLCQNILGSYDAALGINDNQLSGVAIVEGATQSNSAAMPYVVGFMQALTQLGKAVVDLIPKYYRTNRTIPVRGIDGKRNYIEIDQNTFDYKPTSLNIKVEAGVNFAIQKSRALSQITSMMQASPLFAQFINEQGLEVILDNMEIRGIDQLKVLAEQFMQNIQQQKQSMQGQPNPIQQKMQIEQEKLALAQQKQQLDQAQLQHSMAQDQVANQIDAGRIAVSKQDSDNDRLEIMQGLRQSGLDHQLERERLETEKEGQAVKLALHSADQHHRHTKDMLDLHHKVLTTPMPVPPEPSAPK